MRLYNGQDDDGDDDLKLIVTAFKHAAVCETEKRMEQLGGFCRVLLSLLLLPPRAIHKECLHAHIFVTGGLKFVKIII